MLPTRLTLRNFLPYRAPDPISFEGLHTACLTGPNGAGKSALLDAITWALWGRARGRRNEDLITLGAEEMSVELDFAHEGRRYRVARRISRKRRQTGLDLFLWNEQAGSFTPLSGASLRDTQARLNDLLRLDYETFVHSAFLQQGQADAFTTRPPAQRKQILADILGLDAWRVYEDRTKARLKEIEAALNNIDGRLREIEDTLRRQPMLERELQEAETAHREAEETLRRAEAAYDAIRDAPAQLRAASDRLADLERRLRQHTEDEQTHRAEVERFHQRLADALAVLDRAESVDTGFAALEAAREADQTLSGKLMALQEAEARRAALEAQIAQARADLQSRAADFQGAMEELERLTADADSVLQDLHGVEAEIAALEAKERQRDDWQKAVSALNAEIAALDSANRALRQEMNDIKARLDTLELAPAGSAVCPVCGQPLTAEQRARLADQYRADGKARGEQFRKNAARLREAHAEIGRYEKQIADLSPELRRLDPLRERAGALRARRDSARDAATRLTRQRANLNAVWAALAAEDFAHEARAQLAAVNAEIAALGYDRGAHVAARESLDTYRAYELRQQELVLAQRSLPETQAALDAAQKRLERLARARAEDEIARQEAVHEVERLTTLAREADRRGDEVRAARLALQTAFEKQVRLQQELKALDDSRRRREDYLRKRSDLADRQNIFRQLREAFGKNGIPAMIIETVIPELEDDANALLARMTDGRMRVRFKALRETQAGEQVDTLDIEIADEAGARDYAMYSGGEAFRVDFAIRIALSQLLARRAGARLQTLFIDEGFGTQDAVGRERLVEAINAVADDFALILVITHLDDLRDAFPARLEVEKTTSGSRVRIV